MVDYLLIRGPVGVGKTTTVRALQKRLKEAGHKAYCLSFEHFRAQHNLLIPTYENKKRGLELLIPELQQRINDGYLVVFEGVFYEKEFLDYIRDNLGVNYLQINLFAEKSTCLARDAQRNKSRGVTNVEETWEFLKRENNKDNKEITLSTENLSVDEVVNKILKLLQ